MPYLQSLPLLLNIFDIRWSNIPVPLLLQDRDKAGQDPYDGVNNVFPPSNFNSRSLWECNKISMKKDDLSYSATVDINGNDASYEIDKNTFIEDGSYLSKKYIYKNFLLDTWRPNTNFKIETGKTDVGKSRDAKGGEKKVSPEAKCRNILTQRMLLGAKEG